MSRAPADARKALPRGLARAFLALALVAPLVACGNGDAPAPAPAPPRVPSPDASVEFTQILVGYRVVGGRTPFTRSRSEALARADQALARARAGESMEKLVNELTDDRDEKGHPFNRGSYTIAKTDRRVVRVLREAILDTKVGELHPRPVDTGLAFVVFRRDR